MKIAFAAFLTVIGFITIFTFVSPPTYRASSKILIEREPGPESWFFGNSFSLAYDSYDWVDSEIEILHSYPVAARVVKVLSLDKTNQARMDTTGSAFEDVVEKFQDKLKTETKRNSNVIEIIYDAGGPVLAATAVSEIIHTYSKYRSEIYDDSDQYTFLQKQIKLVEEKLNTLEEKQADFKFREKFLSTKTQADLLFAKLAHYEQSLMNVRTQRIGKEAKLAIIKEGLQTDSDLSFPSTQVSDSPSREKHIARLRSELLELEIKRDGLLQRFKPSYEKIVELQENITATKEKISHEISDIIKQEENWIKALQAEEQALEGGIESISKEVSAFAQKEFEMIQISRGIADNREIYSILLKERENLRISLAKAERGIKIRVISPAIVPSRPFKPRKLLNLLIAVVLGVAAGVGLACLVEYYHRSNMLHQQQGQIFKSPGAQFIAGSEAVGSHHDNHEENHLGS